MYLHCETCEYGQCNQCEDSYYLDGANACQPCALVDAGCTDCSGGVICTVCASGFFLATALCHQCPYNCVYCLSATNCQQCQSGFYLTAGGLCSACSNVGCEVCLPANPAGCLTCNSRYYLNGNGCDLCSSVLDQCE